MQGRLIFINRAAEAGLIFGADRSRYRFELAEWRGGTLPRRNTLLEFEAAGDTAINIHLVGDGLESAMAEPAFAAAEAKPKKARAGKGSPAAAPVEANDLLPAMDAMPLPGSSSGSTGLSAGPAARLPLTGEPLVRRSPLRPILIGVVLAVLLLLCCELYLHFTQHG